MPVTHGCVESDEGSTKGSKVEATSHMRQRQQRQRQSQGFIFKSIRGRAKQVTQNMILPLMKDQLEWKVTRICHPGMSIEHRQHYT